jgi:hypothetical protein
MSTSPVVRIEVFSHGAHASAQAAAVVVREEEGAPAAADFDNQLAALRAARAQGWTHIAEHGLHGVPTTWNDYAAILLKRFGRLGWTAAPLFHEEGRWHIGGSRIERLIESKAVPAGAVPIEQFVSSGKGALEIADDYARAVARGEPAYAAVLAKNIDMLGIGRPPEVVAVMRGGKGASDYVAIGSSGKIVGGPYKHYDQAKKEADAAGGFVRFAFESPLDALKSGIDTIQALRPAKAPPATENTDPTWNTLDVLMGLGPQQASALPASRTELASMVQRKLLTVGKMRGATAKYKITAAGRALWAKSSQRGKARASESAPLAHDKGNGKASKAAAGGARPPSVPYIYCVRNEAQYRAALEQGRKLGPVRGAADVYRVMQPVLGKEDQEVFGVLLFDVRNQCIGWHECARGPRDHVEVSMNQILTPVVKYKPHHYLVCHNHPTGKADPSAADAALTARIRKAAEPFSNDSVFVDHVVIGVGECFSFKDEAAAASKGAKPAAARAAGLHKIAARTKG